MRLIAISLLFCLLACSSGPPIKELAPGDTSPAFELAQLTGGTFSSEQLKGKPALINFWATWCAPCRKEIPDLKLIHQEGKLQVVGIALDKGGDEVVKPFVTRNKMTYPILLGNEEVFRLFNGYVIPHTLLLDSTGTIVKIYRGAVPKSTLDADLANI